MFVLQTGSLHRVLWPVSCLDGRWPKGFSEMAFVLFVSDSILFMTVALKKHDKFVRRSIYPRVGCSFVGSESFILASSRGWEFALIIIGSAGVSAFRLSFHNVLVPRRWSSLTFSCREWWGVHPVRRLLRILTWDGYSRGEWVLDMTGSVRTSLQVFVNDSLSMTLQRLWDQEELSIPSPLLDASEKECEDHFIRTYSHNHEGRIMKVRLPLKGSLTELGDSFSAASRMLVRMLRRFSRDVNFDKAYSDFLTEYEELNHMELVKPSTIHLLFTIFLIVIRESSSTTKLRVVFNGSQKTTLGISWNENLHADPKLLPELFDIMLRWRRHKIVFSADMEKMFRQVLLHPDDCDMQRILCRTSSNTQPTKYRLKTVTYRLNCAPFLAIRVIRQLDLDERTRFPVGSASLTSTSMT